MADDIKITKSKVFVPKFDVVDTDDAYELDGELSGVAQHDISLEFIDAVTLFITGHTKSHTESTGDLQNLYKHPSVEDDDEGGIPVSRSPKRESKGKGDTKQLIMERTVGEFARMFTSPVHVNQDAVTARVRNVVASIVVPKMVKNPRRKIVIR
ncbi:HSP20-like chaperone [Calycina marina]|uniref:HSP20-like chaperone n=1 Tax=Calycina marina TaxID=1763456 RepID=A0A9P7ZA79_9HELO|nr:HSP20-like chaperone [Calycina marina]